MVRAHIGVTNQRHVQHSLNSHDAHQRSRIVPSPKLDAGSDLCQQFGSRHVRFVPAISRDDSFVGSRTFVDGGFNAWNFYLAAGSDHRIPFRTRPLSGVLHPDSTRVTRASANFRERGAWRCNNLNVVAPPSVSITRSTSVSARISPR